MAMTVLPTFKTFLQISSTPQSPSSLLQRPYSPNCSSYGRHLPINASSTPEPYFNSIYNFKSNSSVLSSSLSVKNEDMVSCRRTSLKRPLHGVGLNAAPISPSTLYTTLGKRSKKKYLKERERWEIVRRVRAGEKQAHLAKEFGVTRAAVCYLLKNQTSIMRRLTQDPFILSSSIYTGY
ncbi:unnamed protein product [Peronospora belbahrii]|uniref:HTH psq-type domain-containing protein n=1 Tax=Peronospora belbahrii TaxID=622444 RepID=A0AAU9KK45_9STRA|nr:unnamed protein product [Peronospora belbahrii]CAH0521981.1 unnamed protein product [Peronospora belbahrii]